METLFAFSKTKFAAFGSSPEQMMNRELKGSMPFFAFHGHTEHNFSSVQLPGSHWLELGLLGESITVLLDRAGPEQEQMGKREFGGEWILAAACSGCSSLVTERACQGSWHIPAPRLAPP